MRRIAAYSFVFSLVWLGMIISADFLSAYAVITKTEPLKSEIVVARLVLMIVTHRAEWACCIVSWILTLRIRVVRERSALLFLALVTITLALQSFYTSPQLIHFAQSEEVISTWIIYAHWATEILEAISLALLASAQIQSFARAVISE